MAIAIAPKESDGPEQSRGIAMYYYIYIIRTSSNKLYIGQTNNLEERLKQHNSHTTKSSHFLRKEQISQLVYSEIFTTRQAAMKREWQLKNWSRVKKEALISGNLELLKIS